MSTQFDSKGFSAVSSFFGNQDVAKEASKDVVVEPRHKQRNRSGLGANRNSPEENRVEGLSSEETRKQILSIGRKRKQHDDSDDEAENKSVIHDDEDDEEEEEGGRTSIQKKEIKPDPIIEVMKKSKKKKGKKERLTQKNAGSTIVEQPSHVESGLNLELQATNNEESNLTEKTEADMELSEDRANKKKKRHKVRSKQKNIKKDTRPSSQKPEHLRVGSKLYAGRPITKETRQFLNLPESRTLALRRKKENSHSREEIDKGISSNAGTLAVDDLLGDTFTKDGTSDPVDNTDSGQVIGIISEVVDESKKSNRTKGKVNKSKSKFKNLRY